MALYPDTDLPDTLAINACGVLTTLTRSGYTYTGTLSGGRSIYIDPTASAFGWQMYIDPDDFLGSGCFYAPVATDEGYPHTCLIGDYQSTSLVAGCSCSGPIVVTDNFADTYTIHDPTSTISDGGDFVVTRESLCVWGGMAMESGVLTRITLYYQNDLPVAKPKWQISHGPTVQKDDPQSSPDGNYFGAVITVTTP